MKELNAKVAMVTGADSGMGRSIALAFAAAGASVLVTDVNETPGDIGFQAPGLTTVQAIRDAGGQARFLKLDVRDEGAVEAAVAAAHTHFGGLDIMVNNAGVLRAGLPLHKFSSADLDFCYEVNLRGSWNGTMAAIRYFLAHGKRGNVVNVVSTAGINPFRLEGPYAMTKAGAAMLVRNAASEYAAHGIRVNGVCPTFTRSRMTAPVINVPEIQEFVRQFVPLGRMAEPTEIADAVVFLASSRADFITGVLLPVDGGVCGAPGTSVHSGVTREEVVTADERDANKAEIYAHSSFEPPFNETRRAIPGARRSTSIIVPLIVSLYGGYEYNFTGGEL